MPHAARPRPRAGCSSCALQLLRVLLLLELPKLPGDRLEPRRCAGQRQQCPPLEGSLLQQLLLRLPPR